MRVPLLILPLLVLVACTTGSNRAAVPTTPATPSTAVASTVATPALPSPAAVAATTATTKPAPVPAAVDLRGFAGPTDNAELFGYDENSSRLFFYSGGAMTLPVRLSGDGDYDIIISAACDEAKGEKAKFTVSVDGQLVGSEITCTTTEAKDYVVKAHGQTAGEHKIAIEFLNDVYKENEYDLNLYVHGVTFQPAK
jgi:Ca-dependent carbohydrate-binding module xylan-binding